jgi:hypothetical protein
LHFASEFRPDDDELLPVQPFGLSPQPTISRHIGRVDRLRHHALEPELARVLEDKLAAADLPAVKLKAWLVEEQRFQERLALDELKPRDVPTVEMQEIESAIDELHITFAVGRGLGVGESRQPSLIDAAEFPRRGKQS